MGLFLSLSELSNGVYKMLYENVLSRVDKNVFLFMYVCRYVWLWFIMWVSMYVCILWMSK